MPGIYTYIHNWPFGQVYCLASHTIHVACVNFIREWTYSLTSILNKRFLRIFFLVGLFSLSFCQKSAERKSPYFSYFHFWKRFHCWWFKKWACSYSLCLRVCVGIDQHQLVIVPRYWTFHVLVIAEVREKNSVWRFTNFNCFKSWTRMTIRIVSMSLNEPTRNCAKLCTFCQTKISPDEAFFNLDGYVKEQYCLLWGSENSHMILQKPMQPLRINLLCSL